MPIIRILPSHRAVRGIYEYITREDKTSPDYVFASGCSLDHPEEDFKDMSDYYHKNGGERNRTYYHVIVSFNTKNEKIEPKEVKKWQRNYVKKQISAIISGLLRFTIKTGLSTAIAILL